MDDKMDLSGQRMRVPILLPTGRDADLVGRILDQQHISVAACTSLSEILEYIREGCGPFVIGDEALSPEALARLMQALVEQPHWSDLPGIVLTGATSGRRDLGKLATRRGISLIQRPVKMSVLLTLMQTALEARQRQYQVKDLVESLMEANAMLRSRTDLLQKLSLELTRAENQERRRIAELLHDDLQQMLASARLQTELLMDDAGPEATTKVQTVFDILTQAMEAARSLSHELNPAFAIGGNLAEALNRLGDRMAKSYGFKVQCAVDIDNERIDEDIRIFIYRSVQELFFNCAKHAEAERVSLEVAPEGQMLVVTITDDGVGYDPEKLAIRGGQEGGFGLFSIQERTTALGGSFTFHSAPGEGSRVVLEIPFGPQPSVAGGVDNAEEPAVRIVEASDDGRAGRESQTISVMIADDHAVMRQGLATLLRSIPSIEVVAEAADGEQAVALALQYHPQVVLMDYSMPMLNGAEATRRITRAAPEIAVIGLSMYGDRETRRRMLDAGAQAYLSKDVQAADLLDTIQQCTERSPAAPSPDPDAVRGQGAA